MSEMKYMLGRIKGRLDIEEENIIELEDTAVETSHNEAQRGNDKTKTETMCQWEIRLQEY